MLEITVILPPALTDVKLSCAVIKQKKYSCLENSCCCNPAQSVWDWSRISLIAFGGLILQILIAARNPPQKGDHLWAGVQLCDA